MFTLKRRGTAERIIRCSSKDEISLSSDFFGGFLEVVAFLLFFNSLSWSIRWKNRKRCFFLGNLVAMQWLVMRLLIILWLFRRWSGTPGFGKMDDFPEKSRRLLRKWKFNLRLKKWESHVEVATFAFLNLTIFSWCWWFCWFDADLQKRSLWFCSYKKLLLFGFTSLPSLAMGTKMSTGNILSLETWHKRWQPTPSSPSAAATRQRNPRPEHLPAPPPCPPAWPPPCPICFCFQHLCNQFPLRWSGLQEEH